jgi:hypothetical protein
MTDPKEALERLTTSAEEPCKMVGGLIFCEVRQADLSWLIAEREGLEREVERLKAQVEHDSVTIISLVEINAADGAKLSALEEAAQAVITQWDTPNWKLSEPTANLIDDLRALLHPAVPVKNNN